MNILDKVVSFFDPKAGAQRAYHRHYISFMEKRHFEGASKTARTKGWKRPNTSANGANQGKLSLLRSTARDLVRNNPYAERGVAGIAGNIVGTGIRLKLRHAKKNKKLQKQATDSIWNWAHTKKCDYDGDLDFFGIQNLAMRCIIESGEVLARRVWTKDLPKDILPFQIQLLEPDFIDDTRNQILPNGNKIIQGIEYNKKNKRVAYWLWTSHPGDSVIGLSDFKSERVDAADIIHVFDKKRVGQIRGYSWFAPVIVRLKEFDDYEDAQLVKQRVSAAWCAFVHDSNVQDGATGLSSTKAPEDSQLDFLTAGVIEHLPPGKEIAFANPPQVTGYNDYTINILRGAAIGMGGNYEMMTGDYSQLNFSSGRMGWIEFQRAIERWRKDIVINGLCEGVFAWIEEAAPLIGLNLTDFERSWTAPRREMIDPTKEIPAQIQEVQGGLKSLSTQIMENGDDPEEVFAQIAEDKATLAELGIEVGAYRLDSKFVDPAKEDTEKSGIDAANQKK